MEHHEARTILTDLLAGRLEDAEAVRAWEHVAACPECREVLPAVFQIRSAVAARGIDVFSEHLPSEEIVQFSTADPDISIPAMARIASHVRGCPECGRAVDLTRRADAATRRSRTHDSSVFDPARATAHLSRQPLLIAAVLAIAVGLLAYPAYRGIVRYPELRRIHEATTQDLARLESEEHSLRGEIARRAAEPAARAWAGPTRLLFLPATTRGAANEPAVERSEGQIYQPIMVQHRPFIDQQPAGTIVARVVRRDGGEVVWSERRAVADWWDAAQGSLLLLVPAALLDPGAYRLEILRNGEPSYVSQFAVSNRTISPRNR